MSCIRLNINEIEGKNSIIQNREKSEIMMMLNVFIVLSKPRRLYKSKPISPSIIMAFGKTPSQNSGREERPLKSKVRVKNNLKALNIVIL